MTDIVVDASVVFAALAEKDEWARDTLQSRSLRAPAVLPFEVSEVLRRRQRQVRLDPTVATLAHDELLRLRVDLWAHPLLARRSWELRHYVSYSDACYVALAELLDAPLVTLDRRLAHAPGPRCTFLVPPE